MIDIYENVIVGSFIYGLGVSIGSRSSAGVGGHAAVSLLQQTPLDKSLADVLVQFPGAIRILEFKRRDNKDTKEFEKRIVLERFLKTKPPLMTEISKKIHWYVESSFKVNVLDIRTSPYLSFHETLSHTSLSNLCATVADSAFSTNGEYPPAKCVEYLNLLRDAYLASDSASGEGSGGLVLMSCIGGTVSYAMLDNILDFTRTHAELRATALDRRHQYEQELKLQQQRELHRALDLGMGR